MANRDSSIRRLERAMGGIHDEKSTSRNKDILEEWVSENSNLVKNLTYSTNGVKNKHRAQRVFQKDKKFAEI